MAVPAMSSPRAHRAGRIIRWWRRAPTRCIDRLVITGMQTEMCVDSACRGAVALDYRVALVADAHTTYDTPMLRADLIIAHHNRSLGRVFVDLVEAQQVRFQE
jgi:nicotinamidase-related amidase